MAKKIGKTMYGIGAVGVFVLAACDFGEHYVTMIGAMCAIVALVIVGNKLNGGKS